MIDAGNVTFKKGCFDKQYIVTGTLFEGEFHDKSVHSINDDSSTYSRLLNKV